MRQKFLKEAYFFGLLLRTDKQQLRALLQTITKTQMEVLIEIVYNILHGYGQLSDKDKKYLRKYQTLIRQFVQKHQGLLRRKQILHKYFTVFFRLIKAIEKNIVIEWREN